MPRLPAPTSSLPCLALLAALAAPLGCAARGVEVPVEAGVAPDEDHPVRGLPWLEEALLLGEPVPDEEAAAEVAVRELAVLLAHGEVDAARLRLAELSVIWPEAAERWQAVQDELSASGQPWTSPTVTWTSEPASTPPGGLELVLLWGEAFPKASGRDPSAVVALHDRFDALGLRVHALVPAGEEDADLALRLLGALNRPVGIGIAPAQLWTDWGGGRTTIALLVRDGQVAWRGYPSQAPAGSIRAWLDGAHRASDRRAEAALLSLIEADLGCGAWSRRDLLRRTGPASSGEEAGEVTVVEALGCGRRRHYVALDERTWLSDAVLAERPN